MSATADRDADVARLLNESRGAHLEWRQAKQAKHPNVQIALQRAAMCRAEAHNLDPDHLAPAWADEPVPHAELTAFYELKLSH